MDMRKQGQKKLIGRKAAGAALALAALGGAGVATAQPAHAWLTSSRVVLGGSIQCPAYGGPFDKVTWVWVDAARSSDGWASHWGNGRVKQYQFTLNNVPGPGSSDSVTIRYGCSASGQHSTSFGVNRPKAGEYQTRNIY
jgi:hypothetical protein